VPIADFNPGEGHKSTLDPLLTVASVSDLEAK
jgi:hypothetical protein